MRIRVVVTVALALAGASAHLQAQPADVVKAVRAAHGSVPASAWREGQVIVAFRRKPGTGTPSGRCARAGPARCVGPGPGAASW